MTAAPDARREAVAITDAMAAAAVCALCFFKSQLTKDCQCDHPGDCEAKEFPADIAGMRVALSAALAAMPSDAEDSTECGVLGDTIGEQIMSGLGYDLQRGFVVRIVKAINAAMPSGDAEKMREDAAKITFDCLEHEGYLRNWLSARIRALPVTPRPMAGDWTQPAEDAAAAILLLVGYSQEASREPGMDWHRDRIAALVQRAIDTSHPSPDPMLDLLNRAEADAVEWIQTPAKILDDFVHHIAEAYWPTKAIRNKAFEIIMAADLARFGGDPGEKIAAFHAAQEARDSAGYLSSVADCIIQQEATITKHDAYRIDELVEALTTIRTWPYVLDQRIRDICYAVLQPKVER